MAVSFSIMGDVKNVSQQPAVSKSLGHFYYDRRLQRLNYKTVHWHMPS